MFDVYLFVNRVPQIVYFLIALAIGLGLVRWSKWTGLRSAASVLMVIGALPLATFGGLFQLMFAPFVVTRVARSITYTLSPELAYRTYDLECAQIVLPKVLTDILLRLQVDYAIIGPAICNAIYVALLLAALYAVRPLIPATSAGAIRAMLPAPARGLADNPWPRAGQVPAHHDINLCLIILCLVPAVPIGALTALYLRLRSPLLLRPTSWIVALWSLGKFSALCIRGALDALDGLYPARRTVPGSWTDVVVEALLDHHLVRGLIVDAFFGAALGLLLCATLPAARASMGARTILTFLVGLAACHTLFYLDLLPDQIGPGVGRVNCLDWIFR